VIALLQLLALSAWAAVPAYGAWLVMKRKRS
jgi:hypothetical protein